MEVSYEREQDFGSRSAAGKAGAGHQHNGIEADRSRIQMCIRDRLIDEIEEYIDNCKTQPFSNSKIIVDKEDIDELLRELRQKTRCV